MGSNVGLFIKNSGGVANLNDTHTQYALKKNAKMEPALKRGTYLQFTVGWTNWHFEFVHSGQYRQRSWVFVRSDDITAGAGCLAPEASIISNLNG